MFTEPLPSYDRGIHRQQSGIISLLSFFRSGECGLKLTVQKKHRKTFPLLIEKEIKVYMTMTDRNVTN
jgi:hypothetical protein